ncbi:MAG: fucose isomerase, partial [Planctomycetota bacterium]
PIMHAVTYGVTRDQFMAKHKSNHVNLVYATDQKSADAAMFARAAMVEALGIKVNFCGTNKAGKKWGGKK